MAKAANAARNASPTRGIGDHFRETAAAQATAVMTPTIITASQASSAIALSVEGPNFPEARIPIKTPCCNP